MRSWFRPVSWSCLLAGICCSMLIGCGKGTSTPPVMKPSEVSSSPSTDAPSKSESSESAGDSKTEPTTPEAGSAAKPKLTADAKKSAEVFLGSPHLREVPAGFDDIERLPVEIPAQRPLGAHSNLATGLCRADKFSVPHTGFLHRGENCAQRLGRRALDGRLYRSTDDFITLPPIKPLGLGVTRRYAHIETKYRHALADQIDEVYGGRGGFIVGQDVGHVFTQFQRSRQ